MSAKTEHAQAEAPQHAAGRLVARRLKAHGIDTLFTLSGGHLFSIYDGCREEGIRLVDTRHEQTAAFAAEGWSKVTRSLGACALTAGPGVTNGMSAIAQAKLNNSPMLVLGGRAPQFRWGQGSLQEIDHLPFVGPLTKMAATAMSPREVTSLLDRATSEAMTPPGGPAFVDFPLDVVFSAGEDAGEADARERPQGLPPASAQEVERAASLVVGARRPALIAGTNLYWGRGEEGLASLAEEFGIPVFLSGMARGCLPADHELFFSRARGQALKEADVAITVGVPLDFRLNFGGSFGDETEIVQIDCRPAAVEPLREVSYGLYGDIASTLEALRDAARAEVGVDTDRASWVERLRATEEEKAAEEQQWLDDGRAPLHPMRVYRELCPMLDRDATVVGDGGDFVSYAGRHVRTYEPGHWLDPGPFGCLGSGSGYALAAKLARPESQVVMLLGDGAFGFSGMEFDTFIRHNIPVVAVVGNNGIWGLEKHPMEFVYGYSVVAELRPGTRYDEVVRSLGGHGELVSRPEELRPALERAFASGLPSLVNVLTDPAVVYPRKANLA